jgi:MSHA biogenesis protein MshQ
MNGATGVSVNAGTFQIDAGAVTVGNAVNEGVILQAVAGTTFVMNNGTLDISGRFSASAAGGGGTFTLAGGTITVGTVGNNTNTALNAPFYIGTATQFNWSAGTIVIQDDNAQLIAREYDVNATTSTVSGGTLQIGNASTGVASVFQINSVPSVFNLSMNAVNSPSVTLISSLTVLGTLTFTSGDINTGANTLTIASAGSVTGASNAAHVVGNLARAFSSSTSFTYDIGDGTVYAPVQVVFTAAATGNLTATVSTSGDHPNTTAGLSGINSAVSVNRYWTLKSSTITGTYSAAFNYIGTDNDNATPSVDATYTIRRGAGCSGAGALRTCSPWVGMTVAPTPSPTSASATSVAIVSGAGEADFVIGQLPAVGNFTRERQFIYTREFY